MPEAIEEEPCCGLSASAVRAMLRVETSGVLVEVGSGSGDALHPALHLAVRTLGV
jgi:hypothetical protein